jgi:hypothetical protein
MTFIKKMMGLCGLTATLALASGCSDYTYFNVFVYLNRDAGDSAVDKPILDDMDACTVAVYKGNLQIGDLSDDKQIEKPIDLTQANGVTKVCKPNYDGKSNHVGDQAVMEVGVFDYSTARHSGDLTFVVTVTKSKPAVTIAQGVASKGVNSGNVEDIPLIVNACKTDEHSKGQSCTGIN